MTVVYPSARWSPHPAIEGISVVCTPLNDISCVTLGGIGVFAEGQEPPDEAPSVVAVVDALFLVETLARGRWHEDDPVVTIRLGCFLSVEGARGHAEMGLAAGGDRRTMRSVNRGWIRLVTVGLDVP